MKNRVSATIVKTIKDLKVKPLMQTSKGIDSTCEPRPLPSCSTSISSGKPKQNIPPKSEEISSCDMNMDAGSSKVSRFDVVFVVTFPLPMNVPPIVATCTGS